VIGTLTPAKKGHALICGSASSPQSLGGDWASPCLEPPVSLALQWDLPHLCKRFRKEKGALAVVY
jgi:hypothetical protein